MATLYGNEVASTQEKRTQVFLATHDGGTGNRLSLRNRSFVTFFYGGKPIEDFHLIAIINDRIQKPVYANFEDITTTYEVVDGQYYWGTHFTNHEITFTLSTDAITERELNDFKHWFKPGAIRKLVLAENWNRYVYARVSAPPEMSLLPFEQKVIQKIGSASYETSTTVYRGDINITFIVDDPHWKSEEGYFSSDSASPNGEVCGSGNSINKDFLKIMYEDGIPYQSMISSPMFVAGGKYVSASATNNEITLSNNSRVPSYLYYCGSAPAKPIITFSLYPAFAPATETSYIIGPKNAYAAENAEDKVNTIVIGAENDVDKTIFKFTTPSLYTGYNQAIKICSSFSVGESFEELKIAIRDGVNEKYARAWAIACVESLSGSQGGGPYSSNGALKNGFQQKFKDRMRKFLTDDSNLHFTPATFTFNTKTGEATGHFSIRVLEENVDPIDLRDDIEWLKVNAPLFDVVENVGDMVKSNYLTIRTKNYFNDNGTVDSTCATPIYTNYDNTDGHGDIASLFKFNINYDYTYL